MSRFVETTTNTTNFGILYLMMNPKVQKKMQEELDKVVGDIRQVSLNDRPNLSYTNAVCNETQRLCNLLIQSPFHRTTNDVNINGYAIKEGTTIVPQLSNILYDEKITPADKNQTLEKINGFTAQPPPFKCCLERRIPIIV
uniref:Cytochrome P450 n=1 Tax=Acrobeloides nanus TaxID=290746 RepID=A0A914C9Q0_9BILA